MNYKPFIEYLERNALAIHSLAGNVSAEKASWKPSPEKWSILEIMAHLYDEEREDFRTRLDLLLHSPGKKWPPIDPQGWVAERQYSKRDMQETVRAFLEEREKSLEWLRELASPAWDNSHEHPVFGTIRAGDLLGSWVAHDLLHIRQLTHVLWQDVTELSRPYTLAYAGAW